MKLVSAIYNQNEGTTKLYYDDGSILEDVWDQESGETYWQKVGDYPTSKIEYLDQIPKEK